MKLHIRLLPRRRFVSTVLPQESEGAEDFDWYDVAMSAGWLLVGNSVVPQVLTPFAQSRRTPSRLSPHDSVT
jgi:hypothetical protein